MHASLQYTIFIAGSRGKLDPHSGTSLMEHLYSQIAVGFEDPSYAQSWPNEPFVVKICKPEGQVQHDRDFTVQL